MLGGMAIAGLLVSIRDILLSQRFIVLKYNAMLYLLGKGTKARGRLAKRSEASSAMTH